MIAPPRQPGNRCATEQSDRRDPRCIGLGFCHVPECPQNARKYVVFAGRRELFTVGLSDFSLHEGSGTCQHDRERSEYPDHEGCTQ